MDYVFDTLDLDDDSDDARARRKAWLVAVKRGFHSNRPDDDYVGHWLAGARADRSVPRGVWLPEGQLGAGPVPVATYASYDKTLNCGHDLLPLRMVTEVTTSPAHRRRGLLTRLITDDLADAAAAGVPLAALGASEATIYGRYGFGPATFRQTMVVDTGPRFAMRDFDDPGRVELLEPRDAWPHVKDVFGRFHASQRGSVDWPSYYQLVHTATFDFDSGSDRRLSCALHLDGGVVDGFSLYKYAGEEGQQRKVRVEEMLALTPAAGLGLWSFLGGIDLVNRVSFDLAAPDDPLRFALRDINAVEYTELEEFLWIRVLDLPRAMAARPWTADDSVVVEVDDPLGHVAGRWRVTSRNGRAEAARTDEEAGVVMTAETLGSLYLGGVTVSVLHRAGRVTGDDESVDRFAAMADLATPPYNITGF